MQPFQGVLKVLSKAFKHDPIMYIPTTEIKFKLNDIEKRIKNLDDVKLYEI